MNTTRLQTHLTFQQNDSSAGWCLRMSTVKTHCRLGDYVFESPSGQGIYLFFLIDLFSKVVVIVVVAVFNAGSCVRPMWHQVDWTLNEATTAEQTLDVETFQPDPVPEYHLPGDCVAELVFSSPSVHLAVREKSELELPICGDACRYLKRWPDWQPLGENVLQHFGQTDSRSVKKCCNILVRL